MQESCGVNLSFSSAQHWTLSKGHAILTRYIYFPLLLLLLLLLETASLYIPGLSELTCIPGWPQTHGNLLLQLLGMGVIDTQYYGLLSILNWIDMLDLELTSFLKYQFVSAFSILLRYKRQTQTEYPYSIK